MGNTGQWPGGFQIAVAAIRSKVWSSTSIRIEPILALTLAELGEDRSFGKEREPGSGQLCLPRFQSGTLDQEIYVEGGRV